MVELLIPLLIVVVLLIKTLDYLDMLDGMTAILRLIGAATTGTVKFIAFLFRKLFVAAKPQP
jgi:hypothetical protein